MSNRISSGLASFVCFAIFVTLVLIELFPRSFVISVVAFVAMFLGACSFKTPQRRTAGIFGVLLLFTSLFLTTHLTEGEEEPPESVSKPTISNSNEE
jgi:hypothetical protein